MHIQLIKQGQGLRLEPYLCTEKHLTIGYGHKILKDQQFTKIEQKEAEQLLRKDIQKAEKQIEVWFGNQTLVKIGPERKAVLVDMAFNLGTVRWPKLTAAITSGNYEQAQKEILDSKYSNQVGIRAIRNSLIMRTGKMMTKQQAKKIHQTQKSQKMHQTQKPEKIYQRQLLDRLYQSQISPTIYQTQKFYKLYQPQKSQKNYYVPRQDIYEYVQVSRKQISRKIIKVQTVGNVETLTEEISYEIKKQKRLKRSTKKIGTNEMKVGFEDKQKSVLMSQIF